MSNTAHSRLSPSSNHRWMRCPGSVREEEKYPETSSEYAIDGTHSHSLLERCINEDQDPYAFVGQSLMDHEGAFTVDQERADRVKVAVDYIRQRANEMDAREIKSEELVNPTLGERDDLSGTADVQIIAPGFIEVIDYKDGVTPVYAKENEQLMAYGLGAIAPMEKFVGTVRLTIIQPKLAAFGMEPINSWDISAEELIEWREELLALAAATDAPDAPLVPGEKQCQWCKAKGGCSALADKALNDAQVMFAEVEIAKQAADKDANTLTNEQIREIKEAAPLIKQFLEAVDKEALRRFETGNTIDGLKVVHGRGTNVYNLDDDAMADRLHRMGVPKSAIWVTKLVSPAQVMKLAWEKRDGTKVTLTDRKRKTLQEEYITKKPGKLTVVPVSDSREAVPMAAPDIFKDVKPTETELPAWLA